MALSNDAEIKSGSLTHWLTDTNWADRAKYNSDDRNVNISSVWDVSKCVNCQKLGQEAVHFQQAE